MWNSRRVKRIVGSFSVVTAATLGISLTDIIEENTYGPMPFEVVSKALGATKSDLENHNKTNESLEGLIKAIRAIPNTATYYGSPDFFKKKYEKEQEELKRIREQKEREKIKRKKEKENKEEVAPVKDKIDDSENKEGKENGDNR